MVVDLAAIKSNSGQRMLDFYLLLQQLIPQKLHRLSVTICFSLFFHLLILSIVFVVAPQSKPLQSTIEIIITPLDEEQKKPSQVDFLSQNNQFGGDDYKSFEKPKNIVTQQFRAPSQQSSNFPHKTQNLSQNELNNLLTTSANSPFKINKPQQQKKQKVNPVKKTKVISQQDIYLSQLQQKIIDLEAKISLTEEHYSHQPKRKYLHANTQKAEDALYIKQWIKKIEQIGNQHYPQIAREKSISGRLILAVTISRNGHIVDIEIKRSSKNHILDNTAINIVRLSAPFKPIPASVLMKNDEIVITRTWLFSHSNDEHKLIMN